MNGWNTNSLSMTYSNLRKAAEKQQRYDLVEKYSELSDKFQCNEHVKGDLGTLRDLIDEDIKQILPKTNELVTTAKDRGSMRALKWGSVVCKIQKSLLDRFISKGSAPFEGKSFYVCEACGFIYLGEDEPKLCPACKAPPSRFIKIK